MKNFITRLVMPFYAFCTSKGMTHSQFMFMLKCIDVAWVTLALALVWTLAQ